MRGLSARKGAFMCQNKPTGGPAGKKQGYWAAAVAELYTLRSLCGAGMLTALGIVLNQFKLILTATLQVSACFLATGVCGWAYGPVLCTLAAALDDIIKFLLLPDGPFNPVWTVLGALTGLIYGLVLYKKPVTLWRTALAKGLVTLIINLGLNPLCMTLLYGKGTYWYYLGERLLKNLLLLAPEVLLLYAVLRVMEKVRKRI